MGKHDLFENPVDFNDSQTMIRLIRSRCVFENPVDFNDSQTPQLVSA